MLTAKRFWYNLTGAVLGVVVQVYIMSIYATGYLPKFGEQSTDSQIEIVIGLATYAVFFAAEIAMIVASIMYERPSQQREQL